MKYLILKDNSDSFEEYYSSKMNLKNIQTEYPYKNINFIFKIISHLNLPFQSFWFNKWKINVKDYDTIIIFDSVYPVTPLVKFIKKKSKARIIYWCWNNIRYDYQIKTLNNLKKTCELWTFDVNDSLKFNLKLSNQFFFFQKNIDKEKKNIAFFVGRDKGRYNTLINLGDKLSSKDILLDFNILSDNLNDKRKYTTDKFMDYNQVLVHLATSKFVIEICQEGQCGITVRALEAMFLHSKLITNNPNIINYEFYSKDNIFILNKDDENDFENFLKKDFVPVSKEALIKYSFEGWLLNFGKYNSR